jgi:ribulose-5-phosphate 4-epimerase/fuculose-1-phosphate aldolase
LSVLHAAVHEAHPDILAMCHARTVYGTAFAALGRPLEPISQDAAAFFEDHVVIKDEAGQVGVYEHLAATQPDMSTDARRSNHW